MVPRDNADAFGTFSTEVQYIKATNNNNNNNYYDLSWRSIAVPGNCGRKTLCATGIQRHVEMLMSHNNQKEKMGSRGIGEVRGMGGGVA